MSNDRTLLAQAWANWWMFTRMATANGQMGDAIEAHMRGLDEECWEHLFESVLARDEARAVLAEAAKR